MRAPPAHRQFWWLMVSRRLFLVKNFILEGGMSLLIEHHWDLSRDQTGQNHQCRNSREESKRLNIARLFGVFVNRFTL